MRSDITRQSELDPENWQAFNTLLDRVSKDVVSGLETLGKRPVWSRPADQSRKALAEPLPLDGIGLEAAYDHFRTHIQPHVVGNRHPRYLGWVVGSGIPASMVGEWLAASVNSVPTIFDDSSTLTELQVLDWIRQILGVAEDGSGILTSGVSEATVIALRVATYAAFGAALKKSGLAGIEQEPVFYLSDQTHDCARKAVHLLGFGSDHMRVLPCGADYRLDPDRLARALSDDIAAGRRPVAVVATSGSVNTGAFDDLRAISRVCREHGVWLHVDGAFGVWTSLTSGHRHLVEGLAEADSIVFDLHKWMYQIYDVGCVLIRDRVAHYEALETHADYLAPLPGSVRDGAADLSSYALQLSRGFRALKVWYSLKTHGVRAFGRQIERNIELARNLTDKIEREPDLELLTPTGLHIVNFRFVGGFEEDVEIDACNAEIVRTLQSEGIAIPSTTRLAGKFSIRICFSGHRTAFEDVDQVFDAILSIGRRYECRQAHAANSTGPAAVVACC